MGGAETVAHVGEEERNVMRQTNPRVVGLAQITVALVTLAACGGAGAGGGDTEDDTVVESVDLTGVQIAVGSKNFTEQEILGAITIEVLQAAGATVEDRTGQGSTAATREALIAGATDMYWEYTGTGWLVILGHEEPIADAQQQFDAVAKEDLQENDITWIAPPAPANNTYAIAVRSEVSDPDSEQYDEDLAQVETLSDLSDLVEQSPEKATICVASEFATREDGLPGLEQEYGFELPDDGVITLDQEDLIYAAVDKGNACNFGEVFRTDGRIDSLDLRLIKDDKNFFPLYNPALTVRTQLLEEHPEIKELFAPIAEQLDEETLQRLSTSVDVDGRPVNDVARDFLNEEGFLSPQQLNK